jgi:protein TonB
MKAINQYNASDTMQLSFNDIVFENRNKEYGSYDMRKRYIVSLLYALLFSLSAVTITVVCPMLYYKYFHHDVPIVITSQGPHVFTVYKVEPPVIPPPPEIKAPTIVNPTFRAPIIVDYPVDNGPDLLPKDKPVSSGPTTNGDPNPIIDGPTTAPDPIVEPLEIPIVTNPEEPAMFKGGDLSAFSKWVQTQLVYPEDAIEQHLEGRVMVEFTIGKQGALNDITIVRSPDQLLDNEVMRVLKKSPAWTEPRQGGRVVKQHFFMPVFFQIQ